MANLLGILGGAAGYALGGQSALGAKAGALLGASIGGGMDTNAARAEAAASANAFSANQYATRYQTQVKDMEAAGLNPMLAYMQSPASSPTGQSYQPSNPYEGAARDYSSAANVERTGENIEANTVKQRAERFLVEAQTTLAGASSDQARANINKLENEAKKIAEEIKNIPLEGDRLIALVKNLRASTSLIDSQANTEVERAKQMKWLAVKTMLESDLLNADVEALKKSDNFGREYSQFKPLIDSIIGIIRLLKR